MSSSKTPPTDRPRPPQPPYRVLVVDDSAFARKVIREVLAASPELQVVGIAADGLEALEKIAALAPDVITLDLVMPHLDGLGVLRALQRQDAPRVVVVSMSDAESALGVEALQAGALDVVHKPTALATDRLYELGHELRAKVLAAAQARSPADQVDVGPEQPSAVDPVEAAPIWRGTSLVAIGTSTGGPQALTRMISRFPADFPVPIVVALHIPAGYTQGLAARLDSASALRVVEASDGLALEPGMVAIAPGGRHLRIAPGSGDRLTVQIASEAGPDPSLHVPSVDLLFQSAAGRLGSRVLGVVLTGMGNDGADGARHIRQAGGVVLTEAESSCVVYGMPRAVDEAGLSSDRATLDRMIPLITRYL